MAETRNIYQRLLEVQKEAKAPRSKDGKFGKARSAEQILEDVKPVAQKHGVLIYTSDDVVLMGDRHKIITTARAVNVDAPTEYVEAQASAWENEVEVNKYGQAILDTSQVSGKTGSYAKKYALQNLLSIDDTKDADFDGPVDKTPVKQPASAPAGNRASQTASTSSRPSSKTQSTTKPASWNPDDPGCEVTGCRNTVRASAEDANRQMHDGHVICKFHSENGSWKTALAKQDAPDDVDPDMVEVANQTFEGGIIEE